LSHFEEFEMAVLRADWRASIADYWPQNNPHLHIDIAVVATVPGWNMMAAGVRAAEQMVFHHPSSREDVE